MYVKRRSKGQFYQMYVQPNVNASHVSICQISLTCSGVSIWYSHDSFFLGSKLGNISKLQNGNRLEDF